MKSIKVIIAKFVLSLIKDELMKRDEVIKDSIVKSRFCTKQETDLLANNQAQYQKIQDDFTKILTDLRERMEINEDKLEQAFRMSIAASTITLNNSAKIKELNGTEKEEKKTIS